MELNTEMDWTILPPPDPRSNIYEAEVSVDVWDDFVKSIENKDSSLQLIESVVGTGCFDTINMNLNGSGNHTVDFTLTSKGIREAHEAHQKVSKVSVSSYLPESLRELSVEELSERVLESDDDWSEFNCAITATGLNKKKYPKPKSVAHKDHYHGDRVHFTF